MIPAALPHPRLTLAHRFTRDKQIWVGRAVGFLQCADGAMSFGLREGIALALALLWIGALSLTALGFGSDTPNMAEMLSGVMVAVGAILPLVLLWIVLSLLRLTQSLRLQAQDLRLRLNNIEDALHGGAVPADLRETQNRIEALAEAQLATDTKLASFTSLRLQDPDLRAAVPLSPPPAPDRPQSDLSLIAAEPALNHPVTPADFIRALHFPNNDQDKEGFRALRAALEDPATRPLIRAAQDVLTLLSQDGIFMDDLNPDRARPEIWRKFAKGERGRAIASLGGIRDRSSIALSTGRMRQDTAFREAVHQYLREFDRVFCQFEQAATDEDIVKLSATRSARAFMLLGRVTGIFD